MLPPSVADDRKKADWAALPYGLTRVMLEDLQSDKRTRNEVVPKVPGLPDKRVAATLHYKITPNIKSKPKETKQDQIKRKRNSGEVPFDERFRRRLLADNVTAPPKAKCMDACCQAAASEGSDLARWVGPHPRLGNGPLGEDLIFEAAAEHELTVKHTPEEKLKRDVVQSQSEMRSVASRLQGMSAGWSGWTLGCVLAAWGGLIVALIAVPRARSRSPASRNGGGKPPRRSRRGGQ